MRILLAILLVAVVIGAWLFLRRKESGTARPAESRRKLPSSTKFHAVSLKFARDACNAAKALDGRRFLSSAAPRIPLDECDAAECHCRFVHHKDRRSGFDRRSGLVRNFGTGETGKHRKDQRGYRDRRDSEPDDYFS